MANAEYTGGADSPITDPLIIKWNLSLPGQPEVSGLSLEKTLDLHRLHTVFQNFQLALGVTIALIDLQGKVLASSNWQQACLQFHRQQPGTLKGCLQSDTQLATQLLNEQKQAIYRCHNGLTDCAAPVRVNGRYLANIFIGQFFQEAPDLTYFRQQAKANQFDEDSYLAAIMQLPVIPADKIPPMLALISSMAEQISELSYNQYLSQQLLDQVEQQVKRRTLELQMQNQILSMISQGDPLQQVLQELVLQIEQQYPQLLCSILLLDQQSGVLRHGAAPSLPEAYNQAVDGLKPGPFAGSCGAAAYNGEILIAEDLLTHPNWQQFQDLIALADVRSCWSIPIKTAHGRVLGTFGIYQRQVARPDAEFTQKMQAFSNLAELAISRSLLAEKIRRMAFYDELTGLANRRLLDERMQQALALSKRSNRYGALMFLDLNNFKPVNDLYGHKTGDLLLRAFAIRLQSLVRQTDTVARLGGDEFIVLLPELLADFAQAREQAQQLAEKITEQLTLPFTLTAQSNTCYQCSCSIGMVLFHGEQDFAEEILRRADNAMYQAKQQSGQQLCWYSG